ncbi:MAG: hypothetical protein K6C34_02430 [Alphaproteobacteria bacterium]|nr:hypothetical protein [Alphaproteobacteria bacterium]
MRSHKTEIEGLYNSRSINAGQMKEIVRKIIVETNDKELSEKSTATKRFLLHLNQSKTKLDILQLVWNAQMKGDNLGTI